MLTYAMANALLLQFPFESIYCIMRTVSRFMQGKLQFPFESIYCIMVTNGQLCQLMLQFPFESIYCIINSSVQTAQAQLQFPFESIYCIIFCSFVIISNQLQFPFESIYCIMSVSESLQAQGKRHFYIKKIQNKSSCSELKISSFFGVPARNSMPPYCLSVICKIRTLPSSGNICFILRISRSTIS